MTLLETNLDHINSLLRQSVAAGTDDVTGRAIEIVRPNSPFSRIGNVYGNVSVSDQARVQLGDTHIYQDSARRLFDDCTRLPFFATRQDLRVVNTNPAERRTTVRHQSHHWIILWFVTLTQQVVRVQTNHSSAMTLFLAFDFFSRFVLQMSICLQDSHVWNLRLHRPRWRNFVSVDSPFIRACARGDIVAMRFLMTSQQASINDITEMNLSPLYFAITGRHLHAVQWLLDNGVDVDDTFGSRQTSPIAWALHQRDIDITRLLIDRGAATEQISGHGWSPPFFLWIDEVNLRPSCLPFLELLHGLDSFLFEYCHRGLIDVNGWSILDRAASMGTPDEVQFLLDHGADLHSKMGALEWNPLFNAVYDGRLDNLKILLPHYPDFVANGRDLRGWTLLHLAAAEGKDHIVRYLLELGADWQAESWPSYAYVQEELFGKRCSPREVARAESEERELLFLSAVSHVCGHEVFEEADA
ncbi:hypothetical protein H2198_001327 [Neophaeococcomyces mojaviensis]|uniref:Uncharacterized protein n=1 Tax=Neophaeococcomyces mojaviensis TaxID=3383035 RepID=A0ACC3AHP2_9EURO|nr:hypothetical protein H2198_001327 [Knufia sp. JES_112]